MRKVSRSTPPPRLLEAPAAPAPAAAEVRAPVPAGPLVPFIPGARVASAPPQASANAAAAAQSILERFRSYARPVAAVVVGASCLAMAGCATAPRGGPDAFRGVREVAAVTQLDRSAYQNEARAARTAAGLEALAARSEAAAARLSPHIRAILVEGVATSRGGERGDEGILGVRQALAAGSATVALSAEDYGVLGGLLERAGRERTGRLAPRADARAEAALILKALSTRVGEGGARPGAIAELARFAAEIRGVPRAALLQRTTGIDLSNHSTYRHVPVELLGRPEPRGDDDGIYQRFVDACAPTTGQILLSEADPIFAWRVHGSLGQPSPEAGGGAQQRAILAAAEAPRISRITHEARSRLALWLEDSGAPIPAAERALLHGWIAGTLAPAEEAALERAARRLEALGAPISREAVAAGRGDRGDAGAGMVINVALRAVAGEALGRRFEEREVSDRRGLAAYLPEIDRRLLDGEDIPIRSLGHDQLVGHAMLIADVRMRSGEKSYLIAEPWTGRTAWVSEASLVTGAFLAGTFEIDPGRVTHFYVD